MIKIMKIIMIISDSINNYNEHTNNNNNNNDISDSIVPIIVGFFIFVSTCILERVFPHLEGMCSDCK